MTDLNSDNKPFMLDYNAAGANAILAVQSKTVAAIDKMANTGAVRSTETTTLSGVAMETEFQLLNARLSDKANNLQLAEKQMWRLYALYFNKAFDGTISYPDSFNIQDTKNEFAQLAVAIGATDDQAVKAEINRQFMALLDAGPDQINPSDNISEE